MTELKVPKVSELSLNFWFQGHLADLYPSKDLLSREQSDIKLWRIQQFVFFVQDATAVLLVGCANLECLKVKATGTCFYAWKWLVILNMRVTTASVQQLHPRTNDAKFLSNANQETPSQQQLPAQKSADEVAFPTYESSAPSANPGPKIIGNRFLIIGPTEGSTLFKCVDVVTGQKLIAKVNRWFRLLCFVMLLMGRRPVD